VDVSEVIGQLSFGASTSAPFGGIYTIEQPDSGGSSRVTSLNSRGIAGGASTFGTLQFRVTNFGAATGDRGEVVFAANPGIVNGLIPGSLGTVGITGDSTTFVTTQTVTVAAPNNNQFRLVPFTAYTPRVNVLPAVEALGAGNAALTYDVSGATTFAGTSAANALRITGGTSLDLGGGTLSLTAAHVLTIGTGANTIGNGTLNFGTGANQIGRVTVGSGSDLTINATIAGSGSAGFVKFGSGTLIVGAPVTLTGTNAATIGAFSVAGGTLRYGVANAIPSAAGVLIGPGATLDINGTNSTLLQVAGLGNVSLGTNGTLTVSSATPPGVAFGGALQGTGTFIKANTNTFTFLGDSTAFAGDVQINGGVLSVNSNPGIGTAAVRLGDPAGGPFASLQIGATTTNFSNPIIVPAGTAPTGGLPHVIQFINGITEISSTIAINQNGVTYTADTLSLPVGLTLNGNSGANTGAATLSNTISGIGGILVFAGNWNFNGTNTYAGGTIFDTTRTTVAGVGNNSAFGTGELIFTSGFGINLRADGGTRTLGNNVILEGSLTGGYFGVTGNNPLIFNGTFDLQAASVPQTFTITNKANTTINGVISNGTGGITKNGPGTLILGGVNTYSGTTTVNAGTLQLTGTGVIPGAATVNSGAILKGIGTINGLVTVGQGGILAPGGSPGTLTLAGGLSTTAGSILSFGIFNGSTPAAISTGGSTIGALPNPTSNNFLNITGGTTLIDPGAIIRIDGTGVSFTNGSAYSYQVAQGAGDQSALNITSPAQFVAVGFLADTTAFSLTGNGSGAIFLNFTPVPEPTTILAASAGLLGLGAWVRRRRASRTEVVVAA